MNSLRSRYIASCQVLVYRDKAATQVGGLHGVRRSKVTLAPCTVGLETIRPPLGVQVAAISSYTGTTVAEL